MISAPLQLRLWHLFAALTSCGIACWFLAAVVLPAAAIGSQRDLQPAEQAAIAALQTTGLRVCDQFT
jgi:hypothetical protein